MALYEHVYLARQDISAQQVEALSEQFKGIIESQGGKIEKIEYWGVKSVAYRIKKNRKAHFTLLNHRRVRPVLSPRWSGRWASTKM